MPIMAETKSSKNFEIPKEGTVQAVLAEVRDLGLIDVVYNGQSKKVRKVLFRWQVAELDSEKQPKRLYKRYTLSLHEKASLRKDIKQMTKKDPPATLDLEKLVGLNNMIVVTHADNPKDPQKPYANIAAFLPLAAGTPKLEIVAIPKKDELKAEVAKASNAITEANPITDDDIPF
jgi:hypothetical protein